MSNTTLWSGRTQYTREWDSKGREVFVPHGFTLGDAPYCWRVKQDPTSLKYFFVNAAGYGKRWRLPDLHDVSYAAELKQKMQQSVLTAASSRNMSVIAGPSSSSASIGGADGTFDSMVTSSPVLYVAPPHGGSSSGSRPSAVPQHPLGAMHHVSSAGGGHPSDPAFVYDDDEWRALENERRRVEELRRRDDAIRLEQEAEAQLMSQVQRAPRVAPLRVVTDAPAVTSGSQTPPPPPLSAAGTSEADAQHSDERAPTERPRKPAATLHSISHKTPYDEYVDYTEQSRHAAVQAELMRRRHDTEERQRTLQNELEALEHEEQLLRLQAQRDTVHMQRVEQAQVELLRQQQQEAAEQQSRAYHSNANVVDSRGNMYSATPQHHFQQPSSSQFIPDPYRLHSTPHPYGAHHPDEHRGTPSQSQDSSQVPHLLTVIKTLEKLLEHERQTNEKLTKQVEEKDRLALEQMAYEAEREQREIAMRIRMLEAIAAHRREQQLLAEEAAAKAEEVNGDETVRAQLARQAQRYIPQHPLGDDAHDDEY